MAQALSNARHSSKVGNPTDLKTVKNMTENKSESYLLLSAHEDGD